MLADGEDDDAFARVEVHIVGERRGDGGDAGAVEGVVAAEIADVAGGGLGGGGLPRRAGSGAGANRVKRAARGGGAGL